MHLSSVVTKECLERKRNGKNVWIVIENVLGGIGIYLCKNSLKKKKKNTYCVVFLEGSPFSSLWNLCDLTNGQKNVTVVGKKRNQREEIFMAEV